MADENGSTGTASGARIHAFDPESRAWIRQRMQALVRRTVSADAPRASVLVPLCLLRGKPAVLFTKRSDSVSTHKGQVSFPGGRMDPEDISDEACALRELFEEVGIPPSRVEVLGKFHEVMSITQMRVTPFIGFVGELGDLSSLRLSRAEIDEAFVLTLATLADPGYREMRHLGTRRTPFFVAGPHPVWGLTAFILDELLRDVFLIDFPPLD